MAAGYVVGLALELIGVILALLEAFFSLKNIDFGNLDPTGSSALAFLIAVTALIAIVGTLGAAVVFAIVAVALLVLITALRSALANWPFARTIQEE